MTKKVNLSKPLLILAGVVILIAIFFSFVGFSASRKDLEEAEQRYLSPTSFTSPIPPISPITRPIEDSLVNTKWNYEIKSGGGVGGVLTFEEEKDGELFGSFTESGPLGLENKRFSAAKEGNTLELNLSGFPTFLVSISDDATYMTGKPKDQEEGITYEDNFFEATKAQ